MNILLGQIEVDASTSAVIALLLFLSIFLGVLIRTYFAKKNFIEHQAGLPLNDGERSISNEK